MNTIVDKMKGFLKMDSELEFGEFSKYYKEVMDFLQKGYQDMTQEDLINMAAVLQIVAANALDRGNRKDQNQKKFKKMVEKCQFWFSAIEMRTHKEFGMSKQDFDAEVDKIFTDEE
ncbi:MAG: hypothetical protein ACOX7J_05645 [Bacillota bacterium]